MSLPASSLPLSLVDLYKCLSTIKMNYDVQALGYKVVFKAKLRLCLTWFVLTYSHSVLYGNCSTTALTENHN